MNRNTDSEDILGYKVTTKNTSEIVQDLISNMANAQGTDSVACINPHSAVEASKDDAFKNALIRSDWLLPDGVGIVLASRLGKGRITRRITGFDFFHETMTQLNASGDRSCFFLGSTEDILSKIRDRCEGDFPNVRIAGVYSPPYRQAFAEEDYKLMIDAVNSVKPDVLWVGLTAPKQELFVDACKESLETGAIGAIGAVFDFYAGTVKRPGPLARRLGLEWLVRLLGEPRRLWRRTIISMPVFLLQAVAYNFRRSEESS